MKRWTYTITLGLVCLAAGLAISSPLPAWRTGGIILACCALIFHFLRWGLGRLLENEQAREHGVNMALNLAVREMRERAYAWRELAARTKDGDRMRLALELAAAHDHVGNLLNELHLYEKRGGPEPLDPLPDREEGTCPRDGSPCESAGDGSRCCGEDEPTR